jgi:uncharacterized membrane protein YphA (DoxX/SURF4 family)
VKREHLVTGLFLVLKLGLGAVFFGAGVIKLEDPTGFAEEISNYQLFAGAAPYAAATIPVLEIVVGIVLLLFSRRSGWLQGAALIAAGLMVVFTIATIHVITNDINIDCGCFGGDSGPVGSSTVVRDVVLLVAAVAVLVIGRVSVARAASPTGGGR